MELAGTAAAEVVGTAVELAGTAVVGIVEVAAVEFAVPVAAFALPLAVRTWRGSTTRRVPAVP